jgi:sec-independent protein translocase protein TatC
MTGAAQKLPPPEEEEQLAEGTLISHLLELRSRVMKALGAVVVVFICLAPFASRIFELVSAPLREVLPGGQMIVTDVAAPFLTPFKTTFFVALFIAMPAVLHQVWRFVAPGLYRKERRLAVPLLSSSIALFYAGMAFSYFLVFPIMFKFFVGSTPVGVEMLTDISAYLDFVLSLFLAFGLAFETPIVTLALIWSGLCARETLTAARPYVFLGAFVVGMLLAPDVFSMTLMAIPMYLLYETGLLFARYLFPEKVAVEPAEPNAEKGAAMTTIPQRKTPWHVWVVGILALLWNASGAYTIMMAQAGRLTNVSADEAAYYAAQPLWFAIATDIALVSAIAAAVALLLRSRAAVWLLALSMLAILGTNAYDLGAGTSRVLGNRGALIVTSIIVVLAALQLVYAWAMKRRAVLE